jgi:hypothetical protein
MPHKLTTSNKIKTVDAEAIEIGVFPALEIESFPSSFKMVTLFYFI